MSNKKHIDRLYQEKFKDFEVAPDDVAWDNIQSRLSKKKRKRVIPIWWRYAGVAALLLLLFTVGNLFLENDEVLPSNQVVDTKNNTNLQDDIESDLNKDRNTDNLLNDNSEKDHNSFRDKTPVRNVVTSTNSEEEILEKAATRLNKNTSPIINNSSKIVDSSKNNPEEESKSIVNGSEDKNNSRLKTASIEPKNLISDPNKKIALENKENSIPALVNNDLEKEEPNDEPSNESELLSIEDEIAKNKDLIEKEESKNRWSVAPNVAPVYYNSLGKGSHIDDQFVNNSKSGELNTSYGINVSYAINDKLSVRSGFHNVALSYDTDNVIIFQSLSNSPLLDNFPRANQMKNITLANSAQNIAAISGENLFVQGSIGLFPNENAAISQRISYYEIPVELQYDLIRKNKSFGLNIIGGFSTFLLNNNEVYSEFQDRKNYIGKANNINDLSFSANFGVGINYSFSEKLNFNLEPTFKYQINAYDDTSGDFKPYIIGVYTGFSFKF